MPEQTNIPNDQSTETERINRCLSLVLHHDEVQLIIEIIEELLNEQMRETVTQKEM